MNLSFEEKKQKIKGFWKRILDESIMKNIITPNLRKVLGELQNTSLDKDILLIWIDLCVQCLQNEITPKFIKHAIFDALIKDTFWFQPQTVQYSCTKEIFKTFQTLISINKNYLFVIFKQMIQNFKNLNATSEIQNLQSLKFDFAQFKDTTVEFLHDLFESKIGVLQDSLQNNNQGYIKLEVFQKAKNHPKVLKADIQQFNIVYAWKEKEKITSRFYVQNDLKNDSYFQVDFDQMFDYFIQKQIEQKNPLQQFFDQFNKMIKFIKKLIKFSKINYADQFQNDFKHIIEDININRYQAGNQYLFVTLLIIAQNIPEFQTQIYQRLMQFLIEIDIESRVLQNNQDIKNDYQFYLKSVFIVINNNFSKKQKKINSPLLRFLNKQIKKPIKKLSQIQQQDNKIKLIKFFIDFLIKKIIPIDNPIYIQIIGLYLVKIDDKIKINNLTIEEYFLKILFKNLFSSNIHYQIKKKILVYIYSFISISNLEENVLHDAVLHLFKFFYKITKRILYKIKNDFKKKIREGTLFQIQGRAKKHYLSYFEKGIFYHLLFYLEKVLNENFQEFSTKKTIDLVNEFEKYFNKFWIYLKLLVENDERALNFFTELNKIIRNPLLNDIIQNNQQTDFLKSLYQSHNDISNLSNTSFSTFSKISFSSYKTINSSLNTCKNSEYQKENLPFLLTTIRQFKNYFLLKEYHNVITRKISAQETDNSLMTTPLKRKTSNEEQLSTMNLLERLNQL